MADQGKWFKLWCSSLRDDDLENLAIHDWFGWVRFGAHVKENGKDGKIRLRSPATAVLNLLRVSTFKDAIDMIKRFPNYQVEEGHLVTPDVTVTFSIKCLNWNKYQGDWSRDRVRKYRQTVTPNVTAQEEKRREEKRKEEKYINTLAQAPKSSPSNSYFQKPTAQQARDYAASIGFRLDGEKFCAHYESNGWKVGRNPMKCWKSAVVTWKKGADMTAMILPLKPKTQDPKPEDCIEPSELRELLSSLSGPKVMPK